LLGKKRESRDKLFLPKKKDFEEACPTKSLKLSEEKTGETKDTNLQSERPETGKGKSMGLIQRGRSWGYKIAREDENQQDQNTPGGKKLFQGEKGGVVRRGKERTGGNAREGFDKGKNKKNLQSWAGKSGKE